MTHSLDINLSSFVQSSNSYGILCLCAFEEASRILLEPRANLNVNRLLGCETQKLPVPEIKILASDSRPKLSSSRSERLIEDRALYSARRCCSNLRAGGVKSHTGTWRASAELQYMPVPEVCASSLAYRLAPVAYWYSAPEQAAMEIDTSVAVDETDCWHRTWEKKRVEPVADAGR